MSYTLAEIEAIVVGMAAQNPRNLDRALAVGVHATHFADTRYSVLWNALEEAALAGKRVEVGVIAGRFGTPIAELLREVRTNSPMAQNIEPYAVEVIEASWRAKVLPRIIEAAHELQHAPTFGEHARMKTRVRMLLDSALDAPTFDATKTIEPAALVDEFCAKFEADHEIRRTGTTLGVTTGLVSLDRVTGGWRPGTFHVIGARTSRGKTTLAVNFAVSAALAKKNVLYFTVEMARTAIIGKAIAMRGVVSSKAVSLKDMPTEDDLDRIYQAAKELGDLGLRVNDKAGHCLESIESECFRLHRAGKLDLVCIDYVQQISIRGQHFASRQAEVSQITSRLQVMARDLNVPVLALAQLNREAENLPDDEMPRPSHLKESGSLEQDADSVILIHRPDPLAARAITFLVVAKNRDGETGIVEVETDFTTGRFMDRR